MLEVFIDIDAKSSSTSLEVQTFQRSLPFFAHSCGVFYAKEKYFTKRDQFPSYLLIVTTEGCGELRYKDEYCLLKPGSAVVIDCNEYHEYNTKSDEIWNFYWTHFDGLSMDGYCDLLFKKLTPVPLRNPALAQELMRDLYALSFAPNTLNYLQQSNIFSNILTEMVCSLPMEQTVKRPRKDIETLMSYIQTNFHQDLHIDDFMQVINLSRHHLVRLFEKELGITPYRFLHLCRVKHAQILLKTTAMAVQEIAYEVGYSSATVFIRHFKSFTSLTPQTYRDFSLVSFE